MFHQTVVDTSSSTIRLYHAYMRISYNMIFYFSVKVCSLKKREKVKVVHPPVVFYTNHRRNLSNSLGQPFRTGIYLQLAPLWLSLFPNFLCFTPAIGTVPFLLIPDHRAVAQMRHSSWDMGSCGPSGSISLNLAPTLTRLLQPVDA